MCLALPVEASKADGAGNCFAKREGNPGSREQL